MYEEVTKGTVPGIPLSRYFEHMIDKLTKHSLWLRVRLRSLVAADRLGYSNHGKNRPYRFRYMTPEQQTELELKAAQISPKHKQFCEEFLKDFNGAQAVIRTSAFKTTDQDSARKRASITLQREDVRAYLTLRQQEFIDLQGLTQRWVLSALEGIAMASITDVVEWEGYSDEYMTVKPSKDIPKNTARAIASVTFTELDLPEGGTRRRTEVKMIDRTPALKALAAYSGLTDEFNTIRLALKRYGVAMVPDESNPTGWQLQPTASAIK